jgi:hypothetical protein
VLHSLPSAELHGYRGPTASRDGRYLEVLRTSDFTWLKMDLITGKTTTRGGIHGQRTLILLEFQDFGEEIGVVTTAKHLASNAVVDGMAFEQRHGEAA